MRYSTKTKQVGLKTDTKICGRNGTESVSDKFSLPGLPCVTRSTRLEKAWTGQTCSYRGTHAAHNSQLISLQAKQHSESAGQRALIEANQ
jgi:hypothetical protein